MNKPEQHRYPNEKQDRIASLLRQALPPVENPEAGPDRDLWPQVLGRLDEKPSVPWFDWAMLAGLTGMLLFFPASVPVLLYYL
jgi:hypothetical protein